MLGVSLSLFSEHGYRALEVLTQTSTPVRRLTILIVDALDPNEFFPQLAARLPQLEALHIVALVQHYSLVCHHYFFSLPLLNVEIVQDTLLAFAPLLAAFSGLRFLTLIASGASYYELDDEATVAEQWARACPTLTTIILPKGRVWSPGSDGKWEHS